MNQEEKIKNFKDLKVWQEGHKLVLLLYIITKDFPREEIYGLTSQMRRAVVSVTSNIAEGFGRRSYKEKLQFYYLAQGSLVELKNQIEIAHDVGFLNNENYSQITKQAETSHKILQGLLSKTKEILDS